MDHQLVVLVCDADARECGACALARASSTEGLAMRDAAALTTTGGRVEVTELVGHWPDRRPLGAAWWRALGSAIADSDPHGSRTVVEAKVSKSFLAEVSEALESGLTGVALVAERVDVASLRRAMSGPPFLRVIYGSLPEAVIDELRDAEVDR
jgi:hypothetical protein